MSGEPALQHALDLDAAQHGYRGCRGQLLRDQDVRLPPRVSMREIRGRGEHDLVHKDDPLF